MNLGLLGLGWGGRDNKEVWEGHVHIVIIKMDNKGILYRKKKKKKKKAFSLLNSKSFTQLFLKSLFDPRELNYPTRWSL